MRRVTRPGGAVAACSIDGARGFELTDTFWDEACQLDPAAHERRDENQRKFFKGRFTELWNAAGLKSVEETALDFRMDFSSFDDYWLPFLQGSGPMGTYVKGLSPEGRGALRETLHERFLPGEEDGPFTLRALTWAVRGTVPELGGAPRRTRRCFRDVP